MALTLAGFGSAVPEQYATREEAMHVAQHMMQAPRKHHRKIAALYRATHVEKRHCAVLKPRSEWTNGAQFTLFDEPELAGDRGPSTTKRMRAFEELAFPLALSAADKALRESGFDANEITHLVTVTCTGFFAPGVDIKLVKALGLPLDVERAQVGFMGCQGSINGLRVANGFTLTNPLAKVLLCSIELCTLHHYYSWKAKNIRANALFADGAAAIVGAADTSGLQIQATGSYLIPGTEDAMSWHIRDHGFVMGLSPSVPKHILMNLKDWIVSWLDKQNLKIEDIASWAVHPGGPSILKAAQEALSLPHNALDVSWDVLKNYGNMSSATILFILERLHKAAAPRPYVALAFGPGLMVEAILLR